MKKIVTLKKKPPLRGAAPKITSLRSQVNNFFLKEKKAPRSGDFFFEYKKKASVE